MDIVFLFLVPVQVLHNKQNVRCGTISKTCLFLKNWRYCFFSTCVLERKESLCRLYTFYYLRICQSNCVTCATCILVNMEGTSLISLKKTVNPYLLSFEVSVLFVIHQMKIHWIWLVLMLFFVICWWFLVNFFTHVFYCVFGIKKHTHFSKSACTLNKCIHFWKNA